MGQFGGLCSTSRDVIGYQANGYDLLSGQGEEETTTVCPNLSAGATERASRSNHHRDIYQMLNEDYTSQYSRANGWLLEAQVTAKPPGDIAVWYSV